MKLIIGFYLSAEMQQWACMCVVGRLAFRMWCCEEMRESRTSGCVREQAFPPTPPGWEEDWTNLIKERAGRCIQTNKPSRLLYAVRKHVTLQVQCMTYCVMNLIKILYRHYGGLQPWFSTRQRFLDLADKSPTSVAKPIWKLAKKICSRLNILCHAKSYRQCYDAQ